MIALLVFAVMRCSGREVTRADLQGTWTVVNESRERMPESYRKSSPSLKLRSDGTFEAADLPGEVLYVREPAREQTVSGTGRWSVQSNERNTMLTLDFMQITAGGEGKVPFRAEMHASAIGKGTRLYYFSGDADEGNKIYFEKRGV